MIEKKCGCPVFGFIEVRAFFLKTRIPRDALEPLLTLQPLFEWQDSAAKRSPSLTAFVILSVLRPGKAKAMESPGKFVASLHHFRARF